VLGDDKYGDFALNRELAKDGVKRLFLHAASLAFHHPLTGEAVRLKSPLPADMQAFIDRNLP
jgi:23S rRNA pseudouridine955/2504/2580 synthase